MRIKIGMKKPKKESVWKNLTKQQKRNRLMVYSFLGIWYICGILSFFMKLIPLGIILCFVPSVALYILAKLPGYIIRDYCRRAEKEYQLHKNDKDPERIYLTGEQMYRYIHGEVIDLKDGKTRPFSYKSIMQSKQRREQDKNNGRN